MEGQAMTPLYLLHSLNILLSFPVGSEVKYLPAMQETQEIWVWSLGQEYPPEEGMEEGLSTPASDI